MFVFDALYLELRKCIGKPVRFLFVLVLPYPLARALIICHERGGACWAIPGMQTARCAVSIVPDLKRWRPSAAYARAVSVQFTMTSLLIPRIHFLSSLMKLDQFQSGKHSDTPLPEQQQRTGRICSLHTIFAMHKKAIKRAFLMQISAKSLQKPPQSKTANGRLGGGIPPPHPKGDPFAVQRRFTHREFLKGWFKS